MHPRVLRITRTVVFCLTSVFAIITLVLAAVVVATNRRHDYAIVPNLLAGAHQYAVMAIVTSVLTFTIPVILVLEAAQKTRLSIAIFVEIYWLGLLLIMWAITLGLSGGHVDETALTCNDIIAWLPSWWTATCDEADAIVAFSALSTASLTLYLTMLATMSIISHVRGVPVWRSSVMAAHFASRDVTPALAAQTKGGSAMPRDEQLALGIMPSRV